MYDHLSRHVRKYAVALLLLGTLFGRATTVTHAYSYSNYLNVPDIRQQASNWCWAAITQSVGRYLTGNTSVSQCSIVTTMWTFGCPNQGNYSLNNNGVALQVEYGVSSNSATDSSVPFTTLVNEINSNHPVMAYWHWINKSYGHDLTIYGYYYTDQSPGYVEYLDPATDSTGGAHTLSYALFVNDGNHNWEETLTGIHH